MKTDAVYARQSVEKKDSLSIAGQIDLCHRTADGCGSTRTPVTPARTPSDPPSSS